MVLTNYFNGSPTKKTLEATGLNDSSEIIKSILLHYNVYDTDSMEPRGGILYV